MGNRRNERVAETKFNDAKNEEEEKRKKKGREKNVKHLSNLVNT